MKGGCMTAVIRLRNFILNRLYSARFYHALYNFVACLYGVQEAVSSTLATRTKDGCQVQQERQIRKDLALFCFCGFNRGSACLRGNRSIYALAQERERKHCTCQIWVTMIMVRTLLKTQSMK